jgi:hypothetical protein
MPYAAGLAALMALAGCGAPVDTPAVQTAVGSSAATSAATATPTAKATTAPVDPVLARIPAAARPETPKGAASYVEFYFQALNAAFMAGDARPLEGLATSSCEMCEAFAAGVSDLQGTGQHYGGNLATINSVSSMDFTKASRRVLVDLTQMAVPVRDAAGKTVRTAPKADLRFVATVSFTDRWIITRLQNVK